MPRRRQVDTLKQLCVHVIIKNITKYTTRELHFIPADILEDLIRFPKDADEKFLSTEKSLRLSDVDKNNLIRKGIRCLNLQFNAKWVYQWPLEQDSLMNAILQTRNSLTHFTCDDTVSLTQQEFLKFAVSFPNIVFLKITNAHLINDDILKAMGDHCLKLESLTLDSSSITDEGIQRFCQSKSRGSKIKHLKFYGEIQITGEGCLIALQNLKQLKVFDCRRVIKAFMKLFHDSNEGQHPTFQLCELPSIPMEKLTNGVLNFITKCCPNLSSLGLDMSENFENDIAEFKKCDLTLPLNMFIGNEFSMSHLTEVGSNLTSLHVCGANVELDSIGFACPNLKELILFSVTYLPLYNLGIRHNQIPFGKLQKLDISLYNYEFMTIPIPHLKFLLKHCLELEELSLGDHDEINDDVMISVLHEINPLRCLTRFWIGICFGVSKVSIIELLTMENNLQYLAISNSIRADEKIVIESYVKENNYWVIIE